MDSAWQATSMLALTDVVWEVQISVNQSLVSKTQLYFTSLYALTPRWRAEPQARQRWRCAQCIFWSRFDCGVWSRDTQPLQDDPSLLQHGPAMRWRQTLYRRQRWGRVPGSEATRHHRWDTNSPHPVSEDCQSCQYQTAPTFAKKKSIDNGLMKLL